jgi:hypothetical protein
MPVGNGEVVGNVYVDGTDNGSLAILLGRSDVFTGAVQPLKLGRVRIRFDPNPFSFASKCAVNGSYTKHDGYVQTKAAVELFYLWCGTLDSSFD